MKNCFISHRFKIKRILIILIIFIEINFFILTINIFAKDVTPLKLVYEYWQVVVDSGNPGASSGEVLNYKNKAKKTVFIYSFKETKLWPWPEIDFLASITREADFNKYNGVTLDIQGPSGTEVYFYFILEDKNLNKPKPLVCRILFTGKKQNIFLPLSNFKLAADWSPRNPGYNNEQEWAKVKSFGFHIKGSDGEKGRFILSGISLVNNPALPAYNLTFSRSRPPKHYTFFLNKTTINKQSHAEININNNYFGNNKISPYLYGANWGTWLNLPDKKSIYPLGVSILRAGGPFMDRYNWKNSKYSFPGNNQAITMASLDEFIKFCRSIKAEPLIQINALGFAPEQKSGNKMSKCVDEKNIADLIKYLNQEKKYNIKFFEIGNEPFIWHKVHFDVRSKPCDIEEYFDIFKKIAVTLRKTQKEIDPNLEIKIFGPGFCLEDMQLYDIGSFLRKCNSFQTNLKDNPRKLRILDVLSFHYFPSFYREMVNSRKYKDVYSIVNSTQSWWHPSYKNKLDLNLPIGLNVRAIPRLRQLINDNFPGVELALTEFNIESRSMIKYDPKIKILYLSDFYGLLAKYSLDYFMYFCLNSSDQNIGLVDDLNNSTPLYYPFSFFGRYFKGNLLETHVSGALSVYACNNNGILTVMVVNKTREELLATVRVNNTDKKTLIFSHSFPALSLSCIIINMDNNLAECWEYGERQLK